MRKTSDESQVNLYRWMLLSDCEVQVNLDNSSYHRENVRVIKSLRHQESSSFCTFQKRVKKGFEKFE